MSVGDIKIIAGVTLLILGFYFDLPPYDYIACFAGSFIMCIGISNNDD